MGLKQDKLSDNTKARAEYILRYLMSTGKYYPTKAEELAIKISVHMDELIEADYIEEKIGDNERKIRITKAGFLYINRWNPFAIFSKLFVWYFMGAKDNEYQSLSKFILEGNYAGI